ncbi:hypothetical protein K3495_g5562 [Podosphaera aphanis]|nr:hypothetical protein K3495_g5562 [Podosphaera aphanis]
MSKRDFFSIFWEAFEKTFTEKNINSAWEKTGICPFCPSMVQKIFDQPKDLKRNSNALSDEFNSPLENQKLRNLVSSASARDTQQTVLLMENERLKETLNKANAKKRKKTTMEHLRAEDGSSAVFFGPSEIQRYNELNQQKDQEKEQESQEKLRRRQEQAAKKAREEAEKQNKRTIRVAAAEARKKAAAAKKAALASAREAKVQYDQ